MMDTFQCFITENTFFKFLCKNHHNFCINFHKLNDYLQSEFMDSLSNIDYLINYNLKHMLYNLLERISKYNKCYRMVSISKMKYFNKNFLHNH